jgi:hypothetical protein
MAAVPQVWGLVVDDKSGLFGVDPRIQMLEINHMTT